MIRSVTGTVAVIGGVSRRKVVAALGSGFAALAVPQWAAARLPLQADEIIVIKHTRRLYLLDQGKIVKSFPIALGPHPYGPKVAQGDGRTPEGWYRINWRTRNTPYHLALHLSYPNKLDRDIAREYHLKPGGEIFIHGMPARFGHTDPVKFFKDWTEGCISVGNIAIEQIWNAVPDGTPVDIKP